MTRTRRDALRLAGGMLIAAAAAGPAFAQEQEDDSSILDGLVRAEQRAVVVYDGIAAIGGSAGRIATPCRDQEQEHADALTTALETLGGSAPEPPAPESIEGLAGLRSQADVARFAIRLETTAVAAYYDAVQKLGDAQALQTAASIMASHGQHLVVWRQAIGGRQVPNAFETGGA